MCQSPESRRSRAGLAQAAGGECDRDPSRASSCSAGRSVALAGHLAHRAARRHSLHWRSRTRARSRSRRSTPPEMDGEPSAYRRPVSRFTSMPSTQFSRKMRIALSISSMRGQDLMRHHRVERVELQLALGRRPVHGHVHAEDHEAALVPRIRESPVHLGGHDARTGLGAAAHADRRSRERGPEFEQNAGRPPPSSGGIARFFNAADAAMYALMSVTAASGSGGGGHRQAG